MSFCVVGLLFAVPGNLQGLRTRPIRTGSDHMDRRVVFSPHIYGPEVFEHAYFEDPAFPENLFAIWDAQFGFVESVSGRAMVIGEWGGSISGDNEKAALTQQKLAEWLVSRCAPDQYWW
jgi:endoglucanase